MIERFQYCIMKHRPQFLHACIRAVWVDGVRQQNNTHTAIEVHIDGSSRKPRMI